MVWLGTTPPASLTSLLPGWSAGAGRTNLLQSQQDADFGSFRKLRGRRSSRDHLHWLGRHVRHRAAMGQAVATEDHAYSPLNNRAGRDHESVRDFDAALAGRCGHAEDWGVCGAKRDRRRRPAPGDHLEQRDREPRVRAESALAFPSRFPLRRTPAAPAAIIPNRSRKTRSRLSTTPTTI